MLVLLCSTPFQALKTPKQSNKKQVEKDKTPNRFFYPKPQSQTLPETYPSSKLCEFVNGDFGCMQQGDFQAIFLMA